MATQLELINGYKKAIAEADVQGDDALARRYRRLLRPLERFQKMEDKCQSSTADKKRRY